MGFMMFCTFIVITMICAFVSIIIAAIASGGFDDVFDLAWFCSTVSLGFFVTEFLYNNGVIG